MRDGVASSVLVGGAQRCTRTRGVVVHRVGSADTHSAIATSDRVTEDSRNQSLGRYTLVHLSIYGVRDMRDGVASNVLECGAQRCTRTPGVMSHRVGSADAHSAIATSDSVTEDRRNHSLGVYTLVHQYHK